MIRNDLFMALVIMIAAVIMIVASMFFASPGDIVMKAFAVSTALVSFGLLVSAIRDVLKKSIFKLLK